jgi:hypothetical protein
VRDKSQDGILGRASMKEKTLKMVDRELGSVVILDGLDYSLFGC